MGSCRTPSARTSKSSCRYHHANARIAWMRHTTSGASVFVTYARARLPLKHIISENLALFSRSFVWHAEICTTTYISFQVRICYSRAQQVSNRTLPVLCPPETTPHGIAVLMQRCWARAPEERPSFQDILPTLAGLKQALLWGSTSIELASSGGAVRTT